MSIKPLALEGRSKREVIYRNKTLTSVFYPTDHECKIVKTIDEMSGFAFEEFSKTYLQRRKLRVDFSRNVDHGIDIVAHEKDGTKVVVQCKNNRKKPVGPDIVRALVGSREYKNSKEKVRGMIIASGGFTRMCKDEAGLYGVELVSDDLLK
jgi:HJR/Mrr/RecB family endonuclease